MDQAELKPRRGPTQFSLRSLFLATALVTCILCGPAIMIQKAARQRQLIARLRDDSADVYYDYMVEKLDNNIGTNQIPPPNMRWLRAWLGDDLFSPIGAVRYQLVSDSPDGPFKSHATDEKIATIRDQRALRLLSLSGPGITDATANNLHFFASLQCLELPDTKITDSGLVEVDKLTDLVVLNLNSTGITDAGVARLRSLDKLETLFLSDTKITDVSVAHLCRLKKLRTLTIQGTGITDAGGATLRAALPKTTISR